MHFYMHKEHTHILPAKCHATRVQWNLIVCMGVFRSIKNSQPQSSESILGEPRECVEQTCILYMHNGHKHVTKVFIMLIKVSLLAFVL